jgi:hypothetical protein
MANGFRDHHILSAVGVDAEGGNRFSKSSPERQRTPPVPKAPEERKSLSVIDGVSAARCHRGGVRRRSAVQRWRNHQVPNVVDAYPNNTRGKP